MKHTHLSFATVVASLVLSSGVAAATYTYYVHDHTGGTQTNAPELFDYGLRLDSVGGSSDPASFWSFEDMADGRGDFKNDSLAKLKVNFDTGSASLSGQMRHNLDNSLWDIDLSYTDITVLGGSGATTSFGAETMFGTLTNGLTTYDIQGKKKRNGYFDFTLAFESGLKEGANNVGVSYRTGPLGETSTAAGWVSSTDGGASMVRGTNDFLFTVELTPVPLPAAGWLLLAGIGGLGAVKRYRKS